MSAFSCTARLNDHLKSGRTLFTSLNYRSSRILKELFICPFVFVQSYDDPSNVHEPKPIYYVIDHHGMKDSVSIDQLTMIMRRSLIQRTPNVLRTSSHPNTPDQPNQINRTNYQRHRRQYLQSRYPNKRVLVVPYSSYTAKSAYLAMKGIISDDEKDLLWGGGVGSIVAAIPTGTVWKTYARLLPNGRRFCKFTSACARACGS